ncbi:hypothetical protein ELQ35_19030 [Peribacillus cavernae]|uniref:Uncharacterized protein n=1 Tax=Peribacillus cavernae TaxID=1674310 RepID=A0A3S0VJ43_9BACI|nr:hypothetical protein [Peribacillus cavernae]MDQ0219625.1 hypothetical protein [Peribacillus cavernae]RUQ25911.1 hypothetical protein ELQ35_19030 [Peribacillus cavernae]
MKSKLNIFPLFFLGMILVLVSSIEASTLQEDTEPYVIGQVKTLEIESTIAEPKKQKDLSEENLKFQLDQRLIKQENVDGYHVETYREYEIYKDRKGDVKEVVPTSNYEYIRYKIYE